MTQIVRAPSDGWLVSVHVCEDEKVCPGQTLLEVRQTGRFDYIEQVKSQGFGVVQQYEEIHFFSDNDNAKPQDRYVRKGEPLFLIASAMEGREAGTIKGLTPRPTTVMARRYRTLMGFNK